MNEHSLTKLFLVTNMHLYITVDFTQISFLNFPYFYSLDSPGFTPIVFADNMT